MKYLEGSDFTYSSADWKSIDSDSRIISGWIDHAIKDLKNYDHSPGCDSDKYSVKGCNCWKVTLDILACYAHKRITENPFQTLVRQAVEAKKEIEKDE